MGDRAPSRASLINQTNSTLQFAGRKYGVNRVAKGKVFLSRIELEILLEQDMVRSAYLPSTENHHLAWVLGCICGVRPGSIEWSYKREGQYLEWNDVVITRVGAKGAFMVQVVCLTHILSSPRSPVARCGQLRLTRTNSTPRLLSNGLRVIGTTLKQKLVRPSTSPLPL
jgi:hypothetical protein